MTPAQFRTAIAALGMSQVAAAAFLGTTDRQARRWAAGDAEIPKPVEMLLRLMVSKKLTPEEVDR